MSNPQLEELISTLESIQARKKYNKLAYYQPYPKQLEFHALLTTEGMLRAGNQEGKTYAAAMQTAYHLTGKYPAWWKGKRFDHPTKGWAAGEGAVLVRETIQELLCGKPGVTADFGSGAIPRADILDKSLSRGVTDAYDQIQVQHYNAAGEKDGISVLTFKSYEQGRTKFQGATLDFVWLDEEPDLDIYSECLTRVAATHGIVFITFTPLNGKTPLLCRFMDEPNANRAEVVMTIYDALHYTDEERAEKIAGWPEHEREARSMGVPMQGEGRVFPFPEKLIIEDAIPNDMIPAHWTRLWSLDFGTGGAGHPFAAVLMLWDRDADCLHVHATVKTTEPLIIQHVAAMKPIAENVRCAWPHDGNTRERGAQDETMTTARLYKKAGLRMLPEHATFEDGGISTEAGVLEMYERMKTGRFKVAKHLLYGDWGNEFRTYHRKDGKLVKVGDDIMSATRIGVMARRKGDGTALGPSLVDRKKPRGEEIADGVDFPLF